MTGQDRSSARLSLSPCQQEKEENDEGHLRPSRLSLSPCHGSALTPTNATPVAQTPKEALRQRLKSHPALRASSTGRSRCCSSASGEASPEGQLSPQRREVFQDLRTKEQKWWEYARRLKTDPPVNFKFPDDPYKGKETFEDQVAVKVKSAQQKADVEECGYKDWAEKIQRDQRERIRKERQMEAEQKKSRQPVDTRFTSFEAVHKKRRKEEETQYKLWIAETKEKAAPQVISRPVSAPSVHGSWDGLVRKKVEAGRMVQQQRSAQYDSWLQTIQKPAIEVSIVKMLSSSERDEHVATLVKAKAEKASVVEAEYRSMVRQLNTKHETRVDETHKAEAAWRKEHSEHIKQKWAKGKERIAIQAEEIAKEHENLTEEMHRRVVSTPLQVDEHLLPPTFAQGKRFPHRRPLS